MFLALRRRSWVYCLLPSLKVNSCKKRSHSAHQLAYSASHAAAVSASFALRSFLASEYNSRPQSSFGLVVVHLFTDSKTWKRQRCMRVVGQIARAALARPGEPSETAITGAGILSISAAHASEHSLCARCHARTCPRVLAMRTTMCRVIQIPSKKTASQISPVQGAMGHILQNSLARRLKVRPSPAVSFWAPFERSHDRNSESRFARLSIFLVCDAPQDVQRKRGAPDEVTPFLFVLPPQTAHFGLFTAHPSHSTTSSVKKND